MKERDEGREKERKKWKETELRMKEIEGERQ